MIAARQIAFGKGVAKKPEPPAPPAYWGLCFTAEENGSVVAMEAVGTAPAVTLETSFDGEIWEPFYVGETSITLNKGERVYFKAGEGGNTAFARSNFVYNKFSLVTGRIAASGNIMSLLNGDMPDSALSNYCFVSLFRDCTSLVTAPELPATQLKTLCYSAMFIKCTSLVTAPKLPATNLAVTSCMAMFNGCKNLNSIEVAFSTFPASTTDNWVNGVSPTGTFICPTALGTNETIKRGTSYCPAGWTVINKD